MRPVADPAVSSTLSREVTRTGPVARGAYRPRLLGAEEVVQSPESGLRYCVERLVGEGGFGLSGSCKIGGKAHRIAARVVGGEVGPLAGVHVHPE